MAMAEIAPLGAPDAPLQLADQHARNIAPRLTCGAGGDAHALGVRPPRSRSMSSAFTAHAVVEAGQQMAMEVDVRRRAYLGRSCPEVACKCKPSPKFRARPSVGRRCSRGPPFRSSASRPRRRPRRPRTILVDPLVVEDVVGRLLITVAGVLDPAPPLAVARSPRPSPSPDLDRITRSRPGSRVLRHRRRRAWSRAPPRRRRTAPRSSSSQRGSALIFRLPARSPEPFS